MSLRRSISFILRSQPRTAAALRGQQVPRLREMVVRSDAARAAPEAAARPPVEIQRNLFMEDMGIPKRK
eukprot:m.54981 g.54981  ORF g.54981 m.54981 type:complete len:69 (+) comp6885_c0_seq2:50-256(+)